MAQATAGEKAKVSSEIMQPMEIETMTDIPPEAGPIPDGLPDLVVLPAGTNPRTSPIYLTISVVGPNYNSLGNGRAHQKAYDARVSLGMSSGAGIWSSGAPYSVDEDNKPRKFAVAGSKFRMDITLREP